MDEIRQVMQEAVLLDAAATIGPWTAEEDMPGDCVVWAPGKPDEDGAPGLILNVAGTRMGLMGVGFDSGLADGLFIARSRTLLPRVTAALWVAVQQIDHDCADKDGAYKGLCDGCNRLAQIVAALKGEEYDPG